MVISSIYDNPEFWESLGPLISDNLTELKELPPFPWKLGDDSNNLSSAQASSLDEYVLINCLCPQIFHDNLLALARPLVDSIKVPELREIITGAEGSYSLLLVHSRESLVSQANEMELESELKKCLPVCDCKNTCIVHVCSLVPRFPELFKSRKIRTIEMAIEIYSILAENFSMMGGMILYKLQCHCFILMDVLVQVNLTIFGMVYMVYTSL